MEQRPGIASIVLGWATAVYNGVIQGSAILELLVYSFIGGLVGALGGWVVKHVRLKVRVLLHRLKARKRLRRIKQKQNESTKS